MKSQNIQIIVSALLVAAGTAKAETLSTTIDFEGLAEGAIVSSLNQNAGYTSSEDLGTIALVGENPSSPGENAAMIFDSNGEGGYTGDDADLASNTGNVLIVTEDFDSSDPDDNIGGALKLDFADFADGVVDVVSLMLTDTEEGGSMEFYNGLVFIGAVELPELEDGQSQVVPVNFPGVTMACIFLDGSGSVDNIEICTEVEGELQGLTPGFWKNRGIRAGHWDATGYSPDDLYSDVFLIGPDITLLQALKAKGNKQGQALLRHSVAALLNASHPEINYAYSDTEVLDWTLVAWDLGDFDEIEDLKDDFDDANNAGFEF